MSYSISQLARLSKRMIPPTLYLVLVTCSNGSLLGQASPIVDTGWNSTTSTSLQAAGRILNQASFGPTAADIFSVEKLGVSGYIEQQLTQPAYLIPSAYPGTDTPATCPNPACLTEYYWWQDVLFGQDQLRQRVAFELSKLFVVSYNGVDTRYMPQFLNTLSKDAFGNWSVLMHDVTMSPAMGTYLNMANSIAPSTGQQANENYAREFMQLFSIGPVALNQDGTRRLDSGGNPILNYTPAQIQAFARAYTGWTFANNDCSAPQQANYYWYGNPPGQTCPLTALASAHDMGAKSLLRGVVLSPGQDAATDLQQALDNVFNDPSLPPFVSFRLIQALVRSNPSPAYVGRVASVFSNNGNNVRGDMKAVIRAILLDPEARAGDTLGTPDPNGGKLRDPILWWASVMRAVQPTSSPTLPDVGLFQGRFDMWLANLDEVPHAAPSVFGYYSPMYQVNDNLLGPEFQNENVNTIMWMTLHVEDALNNNFNSGPSGSTQFSIDMGPNSLWYRFADQTGPVGVVAVLDALLLHGTMTQEMMQSIVQAIQGLDPHTMALNAWYLIVTSPQYRIML